MNELSFVLNNVVVQPPLNWDTMEIELSFEESNPQATLNATKMVWYKDPLAVQRGFQADAVSTIQAWYANDGNSGSGQGVFYGIPLQITVCSTGALIFDGIVDLTDSETIFNCDEVTVKLIDKREDLVKQLFASMPWAALATGGAVGNIASYNPYVPQYNNIGGTNYQWNIIPDLANNPYFSSAGDYYAVSYQLNSVPDYAADLLMAMALIHVSTVVNLLYSLGVDIYSAAAVITTGIGAVATIATVAEIALLVGAMAAIIEYLFAMLDALINMNIGPTLGTQSLSGLLQPVVDTNGNEFCFTKLAMSPWTLMKRACSYFGLGFSSTLETVTNSNGQQHNASMLWMPSKKAWPVVNNVLATVFFKGLAGDIGYGTRAQYDDAFNLRSGTINSGNSFAYGYPDGNIAEFFDDMCKIFNARAKIIPDPVNGVPVLHFERWDLPVIQSGVVLPPVSSEAPFNVPSGTNASELSATYQFIYATDGSDLNTLQNYTGTSCVATIVGDNPTLNSGSSITSSYSTLKGYKNMNPSCAQGLVKQQFTGAENVWNSGLFVVVDALIVLADVIFGLLSLVSLGSINLEIPTVSQITLATGPLQLWQHSTGAPKLLLADVPVNKLGDGWTSTSNPSFKGLLSTLNKSGTQANAGDGDPLSARVLMYNYHTSSLAIVTDSNGQQTNSTNSTYGQIPPANQWITYSNQVIPLCCEDFQALYNNNWAFLYDGVTPCKIDTLKWKPKDGTATISYRVQQEFTTNLNSTFIIDGQQTVGSELLNPLQTI